MSSTKKKNLIRCHRCNCFCLAKDVDAHNVQSATRSSGSIKSGTPKQTPNALRNSTRKPAPALVAKNSSQNCDGSRGFLHSQLPLIEPGEGMALRIENTLAALDDDEKWEQLFPMELRGWQRRNSALIHPEVLSAVGAIPRSAFLVEGWSEEGAEKNNRRKLVMLWPCAEIPVLRIALPHSMRESRDNAPPTTNNSQLLIRLRFIHSFGQPIIKLLLRPNISGTYLPTHHWSRLAKLQHFSHFLHSYFVAALLSIDQPVEIIYYTMKFQFDISDFKCRQPIVDSSNNKAGLVEKMQNCSLKVEDTECEGEKNSKEMENVYRISPHCIFSIDWGPIMEEASNDSESLL